MLLAKEAAACAQHDPGWARPLTSAFEPSDSITARPSTIDATVMPSMAGGTDGDVVTGVSSAGFSTATGVVCCACAVQPAVSATSRIPPIVLHPDMDPNTARSRE